MSEINENKFIIGTMLFSFSRLNSFYNCKREWKMHYIDATPSIDSAMGQFGSFCHHCLEKYAKGELDIFSIVSYYEDHYGEWVTMDFPPNNYVDLAQKYYDTGLDYFTNLNFDFDRYEILGVEKEVRFAVGDIEMIGYIDLLLRDKESNEITICDHKSAVLKMLKKGGISKSDQKHFEDFKHQLYLYSIPIIQEYGRVDKLMWNMFRQGDIIEIPWKEEECLAAQNWAVETLALIENETDFAADPDEFYCRNLCGMREEYCPYKRLGIIYNRMYARCFGKKSKDYEENTTMCDEWKNNRDAFFQWAFENGYDDWNILMRHDPLGNYDEENCYWDYPEDEVVE